MRLRVSAYPLYRTESLGIACAVACSSVKCRSDSFHLTLRDYGLSPLGWDATFVENHVDAIFTPLMYQASRLQASHVVEKGTLVREVPPMLENPDCPPT